MEALKKPSNFPEFQFFCLPVYTHHIVQKFVTKHKLPMTQFRQSLLSWITPEISLVLLKEPKRWKAQDCLCSPWISSGSYITFITV